MGPRHGSWGSGARIGAAAVAILALFSLSCLFDNDKDEESPADVTPPAAVTDLAAGARTDSSVALTWTAPGDDGMTGTAASYDLRTSASLITAENWEAATPATGLPAPRPAGATENYLLIGLEASGDYYAVLRTADGDSNVSALSNVLHFTTFATRGDAGALLAEFASAHDAARRDLEAAGACLHPNFLFYFTAYDRQGDPTIPEFWDRDHFLAALEGMFGNAVGIHMGLTIDDTLAAEPCTPGSADTCYMYEVRVVLTVEVPPPPGGTETMTYVVQGLANIAATRDPAEPASWVIYQVVDRTNELGGVKGWQGATTRPRWSATQPVTWGAVLALYD